MSDNYPFDLEPSVLRHPDSFKWTRYPEDVIPMWVADMDFPMAPSIIRALEERLKHGLGYHHVGDEKLNGLIRGRLEAQGLTGLPKEGWIGFLTGVVPGIYAAINGLTSPGDDVITMTPIYPPFLSAIAEQNRNQRLAKLKETDAGWAIDFDALEAAATPAAKLLMLCHPHNPTGRVWTRYDLAQLADFAQRHELLVVSDELHADLTLEGEFVPFASVAPDEVRMRTVTLTGPCKTYNTAGLGIGAIVSHNPLLIARIKKAGTKLMGHPNVMSLTMWRAALEDDGKWLAAVLDYLRGNRDFLARFVSERLPQVKFVPPQATYLAWLDFREHPHSRDIEKYLLDKAKVAIVGGPAFGPGLDGFARLNFATSRNILREALERIANASERDEPGK